MKNCHHKKSLKQITWKQRISNSKVKMADYIKNCTNLEYFSPGWIWIRCKFVISQILFLFFHILPYIYITKHHILIVKFKGICSWIKVQVRIHWKDNRWMYCHVSTYTLYICSTTAIASYRLLLCTSSLSTSPFPRFSRSPALWWHFS